MWNFSFVEPNKEKTDRLRSFKLQIMLFLMFFFISFSFSLSLSLSRSLFVCQTVCLSISHLTNVIQLNYFSSSRLTWYIFSLNYLWYRADKLRRTVCIEFPKSLKYGIIANKRIYHDFVFCATESDYHVISLFLKTNLNMLSVWFRNRNLYNQKKNYITENLWKKNVKLIYMSFTQ